MHYLVSFHSPSTWSEAEAEETLMERKRKGFRRLPCPLLSQVEMATIEVGSKDRDPGVRPQAWSPRTSILTCRLSLRCPRGSAPASRSRSGRRTQARQAAQAAPSHLLPPEMAQPGALAAAPGTRSSHLGATSPPQALQLTLLKVSTATAPFIPAQSLLPPSIKAGAVLRHPPPSSLHHWPGLAQPPRTV